MLVQTLAQAWQEELGDAVMTDGILAVWPKQQGSADGRGPRRIDSSRRIESDETDSRCGMRMKALNRAAPRRAEGRIRPNH
jgi:hypothetical protein